MDIHAAVEGGLGHRDRREVGPLGHQFAVAGGQEAEVALGEELQPVFGVGVPQVVRQQGVHDHPGQGQAMAQEDQPVVLGVLQRLGVRAAAQPGGEGPQHLVQGQLGRIAEFGLMAQGDVGQVAEAWAPADAQANEFGLEGIEAGGFGVDGHRVQWVVAGQQALHQGLKRLGAGDQLGLEGRRFAGCLLAGFGFGWDLSLCGWFSGWRGGLAGEDRGEAVHLATQAEELQFLEAFGEGVAVDGAQGKTRVAGERDVHQDLGEHP